MERDTVTKRDESLVWGWQRGAVLVLPLWGHLSGTDRPLPNCPLEGEPTDAHK